ncbi:nucleoside ABC transporter ATP-binding protein [Desulforamulus reducens MI-1]|uniref:Nucleoside ABC transporter ATP-binding protein n=1 Tax=Desulforamulus reducens (strain ATCC BAA-1160 / DSM 100696 / MI-1) TaxID=349161 RepID=A4J869_DESRM|nr:ABC transporter ATP-binding protein [Desulforamulus reducens]ABO51272.1 nucleoside ABC transporter ATP-binding protein [Desulforamulus reducens MI-1]
MQSYAVEMKGITKGFKGVIANNQVNFRLAKGSIHGLLGENGAGKTTLMNILFGLYQPEAGQIFINGTEVVINNPTQAMNLGIGMVHQHFMLVRPMTVVENIMLGLPAKRGIFLDKGAVEDSLKKLSEKYNLKVNPKAQIRQLSVGEQQRVEILSVLYRGADILILDEPTAVLTPQETAELFKILKLMRDDGKSIILITHKLEEILEIADEVTVLRDGCQVGGEKITNQTTKSDLTNMMVGREVLLSFDERPDCTGETRLVVDNVTLKNENKLLVLDCVNFNIRAGEILGLAGVDGNGQKELCEVLTGLRPLTSGKIQLDGQVLSGKNPSEYIKEGIAHIPEDRHKTGLAMGFDITNNLIIKEYQSPRFSTGGLLNFKAIAANAQQLLNEYRIKASGPEAKAKDLSGGNQQKIILAREISSSPRVIIANQPTRGLDIGASMYVREKLLEQREKGVSILLISADLEELLQISDRIAVIYEGRIKGILKNKNVSIEEIGMLMAGVESGEKTAC